MGFFDFFKSKKENDTESVFSFLSKDKKKGLSFEEAKELRDQFLSIMTQDDRSKAFNAASNLMLEQAYSECIEAYELLAQKYPNELGTCQAQMGAAYFFKEEYEKAISHYVSALKNGADEGMMDDNVWEATEVLYENAKDKKYIEQYKVLFPNGAYLKNADKILRG